MTTSRVRLGTMVTPAARWKPWDLASAVLTVDRLSGGRAVLSVGLGALHTAGPHSRPTRVVASG
ncbi:MAG: LLM class flavin-dependent oxidoreductase [Streptosporangiaceae bacterium]